MGHGLQFVQRKNKICKLEHPIFEFPCGKYSRMEFAYFVESYFGFLLPVYFYLLSDLVNLVGASYELALGMGDLKQVSSWLKRFVTIRILSRDNCHPNL